jgi:Trk K+ transport system NAD-binding subunit
VDFNINCLQIKTDSSSLVGKTLKELDLRSKYGINILGIQRRKKMLQNIQSDDVLKQGDYVYVQGNQADIDEFNKLVK